MGGHHGDFARARLVMLPQLGEHRVVHSVEVAPRPARFGIVTDCHLGALLVPQNRSGTGPIMH